MCSGIWTSASNPWSALPCEPPNALRVGALARTSSAHVSGSDVPGYEELGPCPRHRIATRARICSTDFYTYACGGLEDSAKIAKSSDEWYLSPLHRVGELVVNASTRRYLSFEPVTEHIASEMRLILRSDKGKGRRALPSLLRLAVRCLPPPVRPFQNGVAWAGQHRSRSGSPARPCLRALAWSDAPPILPTSEGPSRAA
jgi:hypothetical protein